MNTDTARPVVPVIDISRFLSGADLVAAPAAIDEAARTSGFFQIQGHGISADEIEIPKWIEVGPRYGLEVVGPPIPE